MVLEYLAVNNFELKKIFLPFLSTLATMSLSSASLGFCPKDLMMVPNSLVETFPSPFLSNREKASLYCSTSSGFDLLLITDYFVSIHGQVGGNDRFTSFLHCHCILVRNYVGSDGNPSHFHSFRLQQSCEFDETMKSIILLRTIISISTNLSICDVKNLL